MPLGQKEVMYLGYAVRRGWLHPLVDKVQAMRDCPTPSTKRQVRQFLELASFYRRFVPQFATLAAPLRDLTKYAQLRGHSGPGTVNTLSRL